MKKLIFWLIVLLAALLRIYNIDSLPPSLTWDEAALGYNAYSIGIDGRDEFGKFLPTTFFESFGDFKPPLYVYISVPFVKLFGLTEFTTRFPSALFGLLTVVVTYFLVKEIFGRDKENLALISAFLLAISPWHILLSRAAFEANVATFFIAFGVLLFLYSIRNKSWILVLSITSFVLAMYTFNTARIVVPLLGALLFIGKYKNLLKIKKKTIIALIVGGILFFPLFLFLLTPQAKLRFQEVNIFSDSGVIRTANQQIENDNNAYWSKIIHNRRLAYGVEYLRHYFDNLAPSFLFIKGDGNPKFSVQDVGQLYLWEIPFFLIGGLMLFRKREKYWWIIPLWIIVGIAPAATARETPHALRIESIIPTFQIISAYGIIWFIKLFSKRNIKRAVAVALSVIVFVNFIYFANNYINHYSREYSGEWQYGYKEAVLFVSSVEDDFDNIYVTKELGRPYIYFLFYKQYDPTEFRENSVIEREVYGFVHVNAFGKYKFEKDISQFHYNTEKSLFINTPREVPENANILKKVNLLNGEETIVIYTL